MRILLTGGCGFTGTNFVRMVLRDRPGYSITNLDALTYAGNPANLADIEGDERFRGRYTFVHGDICDLDLCTKLMDGCDAVVHMAAETHVDRSIQDARPFVQTNVLGTQTLLDAIRQCDPAGEKPFVQVSTDEVFGDLPLDATDQRFNEQSPYAPSSPYAASKAAGDMLALAYAKTHGLRIMVTNCSNNLGPYQFPEKLIPLFVTNLIDVKKVPLYGDGRNVRDWLHVEDHCAAVLAVLEKGEPAERYCIGAENEHSNLELTHAILDLMGKDASHIDPVSDRAGHDRRYAIDATKIQRDLGWEPTHSAWPAALEETVRWYTDHTQWWRDIQSGAYRT